MSKRLMMMGLTCVLGCGRDPAIGAQVASALGASGIEIAPGYVGTILTKGPEHGAAGIYFDADDRLWIASLVDHTLRAIDHDNGQTSETLTFSDGVVTPDDLTIAPDGTIYWVSFLTGNVMRRAPDGTIGPIANLGPGVDGIALSPAGRLFVSRFLIGDQVYEVDPAGLTAPRLVAQGIIGMEATGFGPDGKLYIALALTGQILQLDVDTGASSVVVSGLTTPIAVKFNRMGRMYVVENLTGRVLQANPADGTVQLVAQGDVGLDNLAFDARDELFVSNSMSGAITQVYPDGEIRTVVRGGLTGPGGLAVVQNGGELQVMEADLACLRGFDVASGKQDYFVPQVFADPTHFLSLPFTVAPFGDNLVTSSWFANVVQILDKNTQTVSQAFFDFAAPVNAIEFAGDLVVVEVATGTVTRRHADTGAHETLASGLYAPAGLASDGASIWTADWASGVVWKIVDHGTPIDKLPVATGLAAPEGLAVANDGRLLVVETGRNRLLAIDPATGASVVIASNLPPDIPPPPGYPPSWIFSGVTTDPSGNIYVSLSNGPRILQIVPVPRAAW